MLPIISNSQPIIAHTLSTKRAPYTLPLHKYPHYLPTSGARNTAYKYQIQAKNNLHFYATFSRWNLCAVHCGTAM